MIDEEKKAHLTEMRKSGLSPKSPKKGDVPFGVRALQRGIEVDGIWVSRPGTPSRNSSRSKLHSLTILEIDEKGETRTKYVSEPRPTRPHRTPSGLSTKEGAGSETTDTRSTLSMHLPQISEDSTLPEKQRVKGRLNEEALRRLEGQTAKGAMMNTYIPSSRLSSPNSSVSRSHYKPSKRSSVSSAEESVSESSGSHHPSSSSSQRSFTGPTGLDGKPGFGPLPHAYHGAAAGRSPPRSPGRSSTATSSTSQAGGSSASHSPLMPSVIAMPAPTFGPGDAHANRHARRVNAGFEALPAGTFGRPHNLSRSSSGGSCADEGETVDEGASRATKLRKAPGHFVGQAT